MSWKPIVGLSAALALAIGLAGPRWATGTWQPPRMLAADYVLFFHAWFVLLFLCTRDARGLPGSEWVRRLGHVATLLGLAFALVLTGNGRVALADLVHGRIQGWSASVQERYELIRAASRQGPVDLVLPPSPDPPGIYARMDASDDPSHWKNAGMARYFGLRSVAVPKRAAPEAPFRQEPGR